MNATFPGNLPRDDGDRDHVRLKANFAPAHRTQVFRQLLKREFWEHKGGFFWAPMVAGGLFLLLTLMGIGLGEVTRTRIIDHAAIDSEAGLRIRGLDLGTLTQKMTPDELKQLGQGIDLTLLMASSWPLIAAAFVIFFYCLGTLYDERKDRSVLFWKSLPVSDRDTVLSKVVSAAVMAPLLAIAAGLITMFGFLLIISLVALAYGGNPVALLWATGSPMKIALKLLASLPVYAVWAMPTIGWLLLCSAWARSKPFLWAVMIPLFATIFVWWFGLMTPLDLDAGWFGKHVFGRLLFGTVPGNDMFYHGPGLEIADSGTGQILSIPTTYHTFLQPDIWIGAIAGIVMIIIAIRLRRWRAEA